MRHTLSFRADMSWRLCVPNKSKTCYSQVSRWLDCMGWGDPALAAGYTERILTWGLKSDGLLRTWTSGWTLTETLGHREKWKKKFQHQWKSGWTHFLLRQWQGKTPATHNMLLLWLCTVTYHCWHFFTSAGQSIQILPLTRSSDTLKISVVSLNKSSLEQKMDQN